MIRYMERLLGDAARDTESGKFQAASELQKKMEDYRKCLAELHSGVPEMLTANKIPESHICFLDEIFKANDGLLNSLLKALNEHVYTNEGVSVKIPVISFFPPPMRFQTSIIRRKNRCGHCMIASTSRFAPSMSKTRQTV